MKQTWTGKPDLPDPTPRPCTIEQMQQDYLIEHLGGVMVAWLQEKEDENARINRV